GQIRRNVEDGLALVIEVRGQNGFSGMLHAEALADVVEATADGEGGRGQDGTLQFRPQAFAQDGSYVDGSSLQKYILAAAESLPGCRPAAGGGAFAGADALSFHVPRLPSVGLATAATAAPLDPENRVGILGFHGVSELRLNLLGAAHEVEDLLRLLREGFEFTRQPGQGMVEGDEFIPVFLQEFTPSFEGEAPISGGENREEQLGAVAQAA